MYDIFHPMKLKELKMNLKNKIYQMFIMGLEGTDLPNNPNLIKALQNGLGGVIFFTENIKTVPQIKNLINNIEKESTTKPFLSIDQEGGRVERTENIHGGKKYLSAKFAAERGEEFLKTQTEQIALELKDLGFNLNFAPCLDVNTNPNNPIIGERAFANTPDEVIKFGKIVTETHLKHGIIPCTKHFPGHGDAGVDSHISLAKIDLPLEEMEKFHIEPFKKVQAPMIMVAHMHCTAFDEDEIPSSLSQNVVKKYLIETMNYKGLIITDDMVMGGVLGQDATSACTQAIKAGVNILLYRNSDDQTIEIIENLTRLAEFDKTLRENIENSYAKIVDFKKSYFA